MLFATKSPGTTTKQTVVAGTSAAARKWLTETCGSRISSSAARSRRVAVLCTDAVAFKIALASMMAKFPMLEKPQAQRLRRLTSCSSACAFRSGFFAAGMRGSASSVLIDASYSAIAVGFSFARISASA